MINQSQSADPVIHFEAIRLARACRNVVQACLREEEMVECDRQFYEIIRESMERMTCNAPKR